LNRSCVYVPAVESQVNDGSKVKYKFSVIFTRNSPAMTRPMQCFSEKHCHCSGPQQSESRRNRIFVPHKQQETGICRQQISVGIQAAVPDKSRVAGRIYIYGLQHII
jgi:hypothetical protein